MIRTSERLKHNGTAVLSNDKGRCMYLFWPATNYPSILASSPVKYQDKVYERPTVASILRFERLMMAVGRDRC